MNKLSYSFLKVNLAVKRNLVNWMKSEKSMNENTDNGFWIYAGIVVGLIVLAIIVAFATDAFTSIGDWFKNAVSGGVTEPTGW